MIGCEKCGRPVTEAAVFRTGPTGPGQDPHWQCASCIEDPTRIDPLVHKIVGVIEHG